MEKCQARHSKKKAEEKKRKDERKSSQPLKRRRTKFEILNDQLESLGFSRTISKEIVPRLQSTTAISSLLDSKPILIKWLCSVSWTIASMTIVQPFETCWTNRTTLGWMMQTTLRRQWSSVIRPKNLGRKRMACVALRVKEIMVRICALVSLN